ncbi:unnamed protein product [Penicillium pancosmium]
MHWLLGTRLWFKAKAEKSATPFGSRRKHTNSSSAQKPPQKEIAAESDAYSSPMLAGSSDLRCTRCHGRRSPSYHRRHLRDPGLSPAVGICKRRRTGCEAAKRKLRAAATLPAIPELAADEVL